MGAEIPLWLVFALLAVSGKTGYDALTKRLLDDASPLRLAYVSNFYGMCVVGPIAALYVWQHGLNLAAVAAGIIVALAGVEAVAHLTYLGALDATDMSIASPIKKTRPIGVAALEPIVLGTVFSPVVLVGAGLAATGGYVVLMNGRDLLVPFRRITDRGPALAFLTAFLFVILGLGSRFGTTETSPAVFGTIIFTVGWVLVGGLLARRGELPSARGHFRRDYVAVGGLAVYRSGMTWIAYSLAAAALVSTVTQLTVLTDVLVAGTLLREGDTKRRVLGAVLILIGVGIVTVTGL